MKLNAITFSLFMLTISALDCSPGCMSRVRRQFGFNRGQDRRPDYRTLHSVECFCPCDSYEQVVQYGRCSRCLHFRRPMEFI